MDCLDQNFEFLVSEPVTSFTASFPNCLIRQVLYTRGLQKGLEEI
jgi:hypothetical protein